VRRLRERRGLPGDVVREVAPLRLLPVGPRLRLEGARALEVAALRREVGEERQDVWAARVDPRGDDELLRRLPLAAERDEGEARQRVVPLVARPVALAGLRVVLRALEVALGEAGERALEEGVLVRLLLDA